MKIKTKTKNQINKAAQRVHREQIRGLKRTEHKIRVSLHIMFDEVINDNWDKLIYCMAHDGLIRPSIEIAMPEEEGTETPPAPVEEPVAEKPVLFDASGEEITHTTEERDGVSDSDG